MHDSKERFTSRVAAYVQARPSYPRAVIDHLARAIGLTPRWIVADIGSGTGISAELFICNGNEVIGVEPNAAMRAAAEESLGSRFRSVNASAEATTLPDHSIDLFVAAQAFHWFDIPAARAEALRILKPGGWALLMWNDRKLDATPFLREYEQLLLDFGADYLKIRHNNINHAALSAFFGPAGYQSAGFENRQHLDWDGLRARLLSSSYVPHDSQPMLDELRGIFDRHNDDGYVDMLYQTRLFYGRLA